MDNNMTSAAYPQIEEMYKRLIAMGRLQHNWDHVGAVEINPAVISNGSSMLLFLVNKITPYQINPMPNGRLEMRWNGDKGELIVEVTHKTRMMYQIMPNQGCGMECWSNGEINSFEELMKLLFIIWFGKEEKKVKCDPCSKNKTIDRSMLPY